MEIAAVRARHFVRAAGKVLTANSREFTRIKDENWELL